MHCFGTEIYFFGTTKPARSIWTYFVSKMFHDCIFLTLLFINSCCLLELCHIYLHFLRASTDGVHNETVYQLFIDFKQVCVSVGREVSYGILIEFSIPMKLVRLIKICLNETYSRVWVGNNLSDMFPVRYGWKQGVALWSLFFNFVSEYVIRRDQVKHAGLKLNGTHQLLVYTGNDVYILGGSVHGIKKNAESLVVASKETGLEVNADKTDYMVMSGDQNAGRNHSIKIDNSPFARVEEFKYFGTTLLIYSMVQSPS